MKKLTISILITLFFFSNCAKEDENDPENASVSLSDNATTFSVTVSSGKYYLDGSSNPSLKLKRGYVYYFDATDSTTSSHPLLLSTSSSGGNTSGEYTNGGHEQPNHQRNSYLSGFFGCPHHPVLRLW